MSTAVLEDPNAQASPEKPVRITDYVTPSELSRFTTRSNLRAFARVTFNWLAIAAIFAAVALFTNPVSILIALALLGGRQLAFAALMHDCGHHVLFENKFANHLAGQWLCAYPIHRESFRRKIWRDLTGRTGWKALAATWRRGKTQLRKAPWNGNALLGHVIVNASMFAALYAVGEGWLYLMWPASFLTTYMLFARLRQVAEHGAVADLYDLDPRKNTRTLLVRWWERPFVGPFNLNYHLEHHLHAGVPCYRLKDFHDFLLARGFYDDTHFPRGYGELLATAVRR
ncbi:MAG: fatty acid desaturase [bacterium]|nr:fatty acid desaturase [bacterium]